MIAEEYSKALELAVALEQLATSHPQILLARELRTLLERGAVAAGPTAPSVPSLPLSAPPTVAVPAPASTTSRSLSTSKDAARARARRAAARAAVVVDERQLELPMDGGRDRSTAVATAVATVVPTTTADQIDHTKQQKQEGRSVARRATAVATDRPTFDVVDGMELTVRARKVAAEHRPDLADDAVGRLWSKFTLRHDGRSFPSLGASPWLAWVKREDPSRDVRAAPPSSPPDAPASSPAPVHRESTALLRQRALEHAQRASAETTAAITAQLAAGAFGTAVRLASTVVDERSVGPPRAGFAA